MTAFLTGSRAYGSPEANSDVDVVMLVDFELLRELRKATESNIICADGFPQLRFGRLNIIAVTCETEFAAWKVGTQACKVEKHLSETPVCRNDAKVIIDRVRKILRLDDNEDSRRQCGGDRHRASQRE